MKRGFSPMILGGWIILLVVLFFVSVYGVKEGFGNYCVEGNTYSEPIASIDGKFLDGCYTNVCNIKNAGAGSVCYYGSLNKKKKLTNQMYYSISSDGQLVKTR